MISRRVVVGAGLGAACGGVLGPQRAFSQPLETFGALFEKAKKDGALAASYRMDGADMREDFAARGPVPRVPPSQLAISPDAIALIQFFEITDESTYRKKFSRPTWPRGDSGVTVGVGYDLGYVTQKWVQEDWQNSVEAKKIEQRAVDKMKAAAGVKGAAAKPMATTMHDLEISWDAADFQFQKSLIPRYVGLTLQKLPNWKNLSLDSRGALVSLVYNRGASFDSEKPRFAEMREIRDLMESGERDKYKLIPGQILKMKRLWENKPDMRGLLIRRDLEAALFKKGL